MSRTVVIGAGVIGLACAYELRRRGDEVIVLDRIGPGAAASAGNTGWIVPSFSGPVPAPGLVGQSVRWMLSPDSPLYVKPRLDPGFLLWLWAFWKHCTKSAYEAGLDAVAALNTQTMALYDALAADGVRFEMHRQGVLFVFLGRAALEHVGADLERMRRYGYEPAETLTAHEVRDLEPILSANVIGGIVAGRERHVRPESLVAGFVERLSALGVDLRGGTEVTGFRRRGPTSTSDRRAAGARRGGRDLDGGHRHRPRCRRRRRVVGTTGAPPRIPSAAAGGEGIQHHAGAAGRAAGPAPLPG